MEFPSPGGAEGSTGGGGGGPAGGDEDMEARIKRSEARAERSRKRGSLGVELPERDCRRKIGCRLMNLGNSCYQNCVLQILVNLPDVRDRLIEFAGLHQDCEEELCFARELARHAAQVPEAAAKGQALSATWILKYQQEEGGDVLMGELFRQSDPACFMHAAAEWCVDRAAGPGHRLPVFHDFFQGEGYEHEWVDATRFPKCQARPKDLPSQPFLMLNIPVPPTPASLEECLAQGVFEDKVVTGRECDDASHCPYGRQEQEKEKNGGKQASSSSTKPPRHDTRQQLRLAKLPPYLCFRLLRFDNSLKKIRTPITYPEHLDLARIGAVITEDTPHHQPPTASASVASAAAGAAKRGGAGGGGGGGSSSGSGRSSPRVAAAAAAAAAAGTKEGDEEGKGEGAEAGAGGGGTRPSRGAAGPVEYDLMAVVVHQGRTRQRGHYYLYHRVLEGDGGHYLDYKKKRAKPSNSSSGSAAAAAAAAHHEEEEEQASSSPPMESRWWLFDDAKRHDEVDPPRVLKAQDEVYMLVYRRRGLGQQEGQEDGGGAASAAGAAAARRGSGGGGGGGGSRRSSRAPTPTVETAARSASPPPPKSPESPREGATRSPTPARQSPRAAAAARGGSRQGRG